MSTESKRSSRPSILRSVSTRLTTRDFKDVGHGNVNMAGPNAEAAATSFSLSSSSSSTSSPWLLTQQQERAELEAGEEKEKNVSTSKPSLGHVPEDIERWLQASRFAVMWRAIKEFMQNVQSSGISDLASQLMLAHSQSIIEGHSISDLQRQREHMKLVKLSRKGQHTTTGLYNVYANRGGIFRRREEKNQDENEKAFHCDEHSDNNASKHGYQFTGELYATEEEVIEYARRGRSQYFPLRHPSPSTQRIEIEVFAISNPSRFDPTCIYATVKWILVTSAYPGIKARDYLVLECIKKQPLSSHVHGDTPKRLAKTTLSFPEEKEHREREEIEHLEHESNRDNQRRKSVTLHKASKNPSKAKTMERANLIHCMQSINIPEFPNITQLVLRAQLDPLLTYWQPSSTIPFLYRVMSWINMDFQGHLLHAYCRKFALQHFQYLFEMETILHQRRLYAMKQIYSRTSTRFPWKKQKSLKHITTLTCNCSVCSQNKHYVQLSSCSVCQNEVCAECCQTCVMSVHYVPQHALGWKKSASWEICAICSYQVTTLTDSLLAARLIKGEKKSSSGM